MDGSPARLRQVGRQFPEQLGLAEGKFHGDPVDAVASEVRAESVVFDFDGRAIDAVDRIGPVLQGVVAVRGIAAIPDPVEVGLSRVETVDAVVTSSSGQEV